MSSLLVNRGWDRSAETAAVVYGLVQCYLSTIACLVLPVWYCLSGIACLVVSKSSCQIEICL